MTRWRSTAKSWARPTPQMPRRERSARISPNRSRRIRCTAPICPRTAGAGDRLLLLRDRNLPLGSVEKLHNNTVPLAGRGEFSDPLLSPPRVKRASRGARSKSAAPDACFRGHDEEVAGARDTGERPAVSSSFCAAGRNRPFRSISRSMVRGGTRRCRRCCSFRSWSCCPAASPRSLRSPGSARRVWSLSARRKSLSPSLGVAALLLGCLLSMGAVSALWSVTPLRSLTVAARLAGLFAARACACRCRRFASPRRAG